MFKSIMRLLIAATAIVAMSGPTAAYAFVRDTGGGPATSGHAQALIVPSVPRATASASEGFRWGDAGVGAAGVVVLLGAAAGAAGVLRQRRAHRPIAG